MMLLTQSAILERGLVLVGHRENRLARLCNGKKGQLFATEFGKSATVASAVWNALQTVELSAFKIRNAEDKDLVEFLWTLHWLKVYPTEEALESRTHWCNKTIRSRLRKMVERIAALKDEKIVWPDAWNNPNSPIFICSVDGTHCPIQEPTKGHKYSKNPKYYSHKFQRAALAYEVAIAIYESKVVWINGPFPAGMGDDDIFADQGLKDKVPAGKRVIADSVYRRRDLPMISVSYRADSPDVRLFKRRVWSRQESFFGKMKVFNVLNYMFRHGEAHHKTCFMACAVICQFEIDETPLFDP